MSFSTARYPSATFGQSIRSARLEAGLRQCDVAQAIGVNATTVMRWESYATVPMRGYQEVRRLCNFLGIRWHVLEEQFPHRRALLA